MLLCCIVALATSGSASSGAFPGKNGLIVFTSRSEPFGKGEVLTMTATGGGVQRVAEFEGLGYPAWSPSGQLIAFSRVDDEDGDSIYLVRPDSTGFRKLALGDDPAWSPNGKKIITPKWSSRVVLITVATGASIE